MQLTSPFFLFLFYPISLLPILFLPKRYRRLALSLISVIFFAAINMGNPTGLAHILFVVFFTVCLAYLPIPRSVRGGKLRALLMVCLPLFSFVAARLLCEYGNGIYHYPVGLLFVTLHTVSYAVDYARGDVVCPRNPLELIGYLLFFPTLSMGPVIRSKHYFDLTEEMAFTPALFTDGARRYMLGYIKRLAVAAVALRALTDILSRSDIFFHPVSLLLLLLLSYLTFYFFVTGTTDMALGICAMYGISLPRGSNTAPVFSAAPHKMLQAMLRSLRLFLLDYLYTPLRRRFGKRTAKAFAALLLPALTVLIWRTRPEMLLLAAPILLVGGLCLIPAVKRFFTPRRHPLRLLLALLSTLPISVFTLATVLEKPLQLLALCEAARDGTGGTFRLYAVLGTVRDIRYLTVLVLLLALLAPYAYLRPWLLRRARPRTRQIVTVTETVLLFAAFLLSLIYFLPQFPELSEVGLYRM